MVHLPELLPIVLVPGGFYDDPPVTASDFWVTSGVASALSRLGVEFTLHERPGAPRSWTEEVDALVGTILDAGHEKVAIVAASNGCSVALRLAIEHPDLAVRTMLCWPATAADPVIDELARIIIGDVHDADVASELLEGEPIRGVSLDVLAALTHECVIYPSLPENKVHQRATVFALLDAIPGSILVGGSPEPPDDAFSGFVDTFANVVAAFSRVEHDD